MTVLQENWKDLISPNSINVELVDKLESHAIITIEPLERGYGITLGNALRRILLSSIKGFAVTSVKIDTVLHEYSVINGIREDVADILLNIKSLIITKPTPAPTTLKLKLNKKGTIYARDIVLNGGVEILNPDLVICNIEDPNLNLNVDLNVEYGMGYALTEDRDNSGKDVSTIYLDSLFNPVRRVSYTVENARIGQQTDYDKLILEVETNGTITAEEVVGIAAMILQKQLDIFISFEVVDNPTKNSDTSSSESQKQSSLMNVLNKKIDEMELSVRSYNCLINEGIKYIGNLVQKSESDMLRLPNFGKKSLNELKENLKLLGLSFGMKVDEWAANAPTELSKKKKE